jgi:lysophospholipase L1-like esterase
MFHSVAAVRRCRSLKVWQRVRWRLRRRAGRIHGGGPLLVAMGDSLTDPSSGSTFPWQVWLLRAGRTGYKTVNLGVSGDTTGDMRRRVERMVSEGPPDIAVLFGGSNDAFFGVDPAETEQNVEFMVEWLRDHGARRIVLISPGLLNWSVDASGWIAPLDEVRSVLAEVAKRHGVIFVDLARFLRDRLDRGEDPDFSRVPYRRSRSWHVTDGDPHFNAYGQRLVAEAFLAAMHEDEPSA